MITLCTTLRLFQWRNANQQFRLLSGARCLMILITGGIFALRMLRVAPAPQVVAGQILAWAIAETVKQAPGVQLASGAYIPGDILLLFVL